MPTEIERLRVATYNVWNDPPTWRQRFAALCEVLRDVDADFVALQEVPVGEPEASAVIDELQAATDYPHAVFRVYPEDPEEGLAVLGKAPFEAAECGWQTGWSALADCGLRVSARAGDRRIALTDVHLDYRTIGRREEQILALASWIDDAQDTDLEVLLGDFNSSPSSSVHRFLTGEQTLAGRDTGVWQDAAHHAEALHGRSAGHTLDFFANPRWHGQPIVESPRRVDWILIRADEEKPVTVQESRLFGRRPRGRPAIVASDHNGVYADLELHPV